METGFNSHTFTQHWWEENIHFIVPSACHESTLEEENNSTHGICLLKMDLKICFSEPKIKKKLQFVHESV